MRSVAVLVLLVLAACDSGSGPANGCTEIGCADGLSIDFTLTERGSYQITVDAAGARTTCTATLPLPASDNPNPCDRAGVILIRSGSALPASQQSLGGLMHPTTTATSVSVRITRDGALVRQDTFTPAYRTSRPNGPDCEPVCTQASHTLR